MFLLKFSFKKKGHNNLFYYHFQFYFKFISELLKYFWVIYVCLSTSRLINSWQTHPSSWCMFLTSLSKTLFLSWQISKYHRNYTYNISSGKHPKHIVLSVDLSSFLVEPDLGCKYKSIWIIFSNVVNPAL